MVPIWLVAIPKVNIYLTSNFIKNLLAFPFFLNNIDSAKDQEVTNLLNKYYNAFFMNAAAGNNLKTAD